MRAEVYVDEPISWPCLANLALLDAYNKPSVGVVNGQLAVKLSLLHCVDSEQEIDKAVSEIFAMYGHARYRLTFSKRQLNLVVNGNSRSPHCYRVGAIMIEVECDKCKRRFHVEGYMKGTRRRMVSGNPEKWLQSWSAKTNCASACKMARRLRLWMNRIQCSMMT